MAKGELNGNGEYKLGIEKRMSTMETQVNEIKNNHLVNIQTSIDNLEKKMDEISIANARWGGALAVIFAISQALIIYFLTRG